MPLDYRRMMQEHLDGVLDEQHEEELWKHLQEDEEAAAENAQLNQVHQLFADAPLLRAPERLAVTIMARLSQELEAQASLKPLPNEIKMALMTSASLVTLSMMPAMLAASYMVMNRMRQPDLLQDVAGRVILLQLMMVRSLAVLLEEIERTVERDPEKAQMAMALIPIALQAMLEYIEDSVDDDAENIAYADEQQQS